MTNQHHTSQTHSSNEKALAARLLIATLTCLLLWAAAVLKWGLPALFLPAVAAVPVLLGLLVVISRG